MLLDQSSRLLYVASIDISRPEGPSVNEREFILSLVERFGAQIKVVLPRPEAEVEELRHENLEFLPRISHGNPVAFLRHQFALVCSLIRANRSSPYRLVITRIGLFPLGFLLAWILGPFPYAIRTLGGYPEEIPTTKSPGKILLWRLVMPAHRLLLCLVARRALAVDACTVGHIEGIVHRLGVVRENVKLIGNATNVKRFSPQPRQTPRAALGLHRADPLIGYIGGRPWECGALELIAVAPLLIEKFPHLGILVVGGGRGLGTVLDAAKHYGVADRLFAPGIVPYEKIPDYVNALDLGIAFETPRRKDIIGSSNQKIRQYIACGKPVVATHLGNEFIASNGLGSTVDGGNREELHREIDRWLSLDELAKAQHSAHARSYALQYLSTDVTLIERLEFWSERLANSS